MDWPEAKNLEPGVWGSVRRLTLFGLAQRFSFDEFPQQFIDPSLVARTMRLEPKDDVRIQPDRNDDFGGSAGALMSDDSQIRYIGIVHNS